MSMHEKNEIILYQAEYSTQVEVKVEDETVWLSQNQMISLFKRDQSVVSRHINNIFKEGELEKKSNMQKMHISGSDKPVAFYNLNVIISVEYRVKSKQGTQFRIWATQVLKDHLLKGYSVNNRMNQIENKVDTLSERVERIDLEIHTSLPPKQGIFYNGQIFDAYKLVSDIIRTAQSSIVLIDNYIDDSVLMLFTKCSSDIELLVYTKTISKILKQDLDKYNAQYSNIKINKLNTAHDRFLIIDKKEVYHFGASLKDLGKKWFAFSKLDMNVIDIIEKL